MQGDPRGTTELDFQLQGPLVWCLSSFFFSRFPGGSEDLSADRSAGLDEIISSHGRLFYNVYTRSKVVAVDNVLRSFCSSMSVIRREKVYPVE